jgi:hypothetical protein
MEVVSVRLSPYFVSETTSCISIKFDFDLCKPNMQTVVYQNENKLYQFS